MPPLEIDFVAILQSILWFLALFLAPLFQLYF